MTSNPSSSNDAALGALLAYLLREHPFGDGLARSAIAGPALGRGRVEHDADRGDVVAARERDPVGSPGRIETERVDDRRQVPSGAVGDDRFQERERVFGRG